MIYLVSKIIISLLGALGIGFGMAWALQMHLAAKLREQLNSVIFETKSRIPALESEITNRDQAIDGLREELATAAKLEKKINPAGSKEQEKQIDELRQKVIDLETELERATGSGNEDVVFELPEEDLLDEEPGELEEDDEFLNDISDIFDEDDSDDQATEDSHGDVSAKDSKESQTSMEDELQNELENWDDPDGTKDAEHSESDKDQTAKNNIDAESPVKLAVHNTPRAGSAELKEKLKALEENRAVANAIEANVDDDPDTLREKLGLLADSRKELNDVVDAQGKELASLEQQRNLQDKSLNVLNQQLELARMANERILQEMRELKDDNPSADSESQSAAGG